MKLTETPASAFAGTIVNAKIVAARSACLPMTFAPLTPLPHLYVNRRRAVPRKTLLAETTLPAEWPAAEMGVTASTEEAVHENKLAHRPGDRLGEHGLGNRQAVVDQRHMRREADGTAKTDAGPDHSRRNRNP